MHTRDVRRETPGEGAGMINKKFVEKMLKHYTLTGQLVLYDYLQENGDESNLAHQFMLSQVIFNINVLKIEEMAHAMGPLADDKIIKLDDEHSEVMIMPCKDTFKIWFVGQPRYPAAVSSDKKRKATKTLLPILQKRFDKALSIGPGHLLSFRAEQAHKIDKALRSKLLF